jgi:tRNA G18 (ribose-2'-O)-methylase SpoU
MKNKPSNTGYYGIGIYHPKYDVNIGTLWRAAYNFGASFIFSVSDRFNNHKRRRSNADTCKSWQSIPYMTFRNIETLIDTFPDIQLIGIEQTKDSLEVSKAFHPDRSIYLLGAEDHGLPEKVLKKCQKVLHIDSKQCINVSTAGSIVLYDRLTKKNKRCLHVL